MTGAGGKENCEKVVDILGLRAIFPLFMKSPKGNKRSGETRLENEGKIKLLFLNFRPIFSFSERIISCIASLIRNCTGSNHVRVLNKFTENDHEKVR